MVAAAQGVRGGGAMEAASAALAALGNLVYNLIKYTVPSPCVPPFAASASNLATHCCAERRLPTFAHKAMGASAFLFKTRDSGPAR